MGARTPSPPDGRGLLRVLKDMLDRLNTSSEKAPLNYFPELAHLYGEGYFFSTSEIHKMSDFMNTFLDTQTNFEYSVSQMMGESGTEGATILLLLSRLIAFTFCYNPRGLGPQLDCFHPKTDRYDQCIEKLNINSTWAVVSLNYDMLFEQALERKMVPYFYPEIKTTPIGELDYLPLYKIHGSINWFPIRPQTLHQPTPTDCQRLKATTGLSYDKNNNRFSHDFPGIFSSDYDLIYQELVREGELERCPVLAHFAPRKPVDINFSQIERIRRDCIQDIKGVKRAFIIGVRPIDQKDDPNLFAIFDNLKGKDVIYVNPDMFANKKMNQDFGFAYSPHTFERWLSLVHPSKPLI